MLAAAANDDTNANKFCSLGVLLYGALAVGAGLIWLVGVVIGLAVSAMTGPPRLRWSCVEGPDRPGTLDCPTCGEPLDDVATPARRRTRHRFRAYRNRRRLTR